MAAHGPCAVFLLPLVFAVLDSSAKGGRMKIIGKRTARILLRAEETAFVGRFNFK
jgi:hypothetical protein